MNRLYILIALIAFLAAMVGSYITRYTIESNSMLVESKTPGVIYSCHVQDKWGW